MPTMTTTTMMMMNAVLRKRYGADAESVLETGEMPRPEIGAGEVLVQVRAAGLDRGTWHQMTGLPYAARLAFGLRAPRQPVPGRDLAGVVVEVGDDVTRFEPGDEVYGTGDGSFAEYAAAAEKRLARKPSNLTFEQAAAVPVSGLTALQGLVDVGRLEAGRHVLVIGASGGVGTFAVQIAKARGAEVTGVCSTGKVELVRSIGADDVIDYTRDDFAAGDRRYDLILDIGGSSSLARLRRPLAPRGTLVIAGGEVGTWLGIGRQLRAVAMSPFTRQRLTMLVSKERHDDLERLTEMIEGGRVAPVVERIYPLDQAAMAMERLASGQVTGKLVVVPGGSDAAN